MEQGLDGREAGAEVGEVGLDAGQAIKDGVRLPGGHEELDAGNVRRAFRTAIRGALGVDADEWTPRELRHSFVSLLSDSGVPLEEISRLAGHKTTLVTETVYRKQLRPVMQAGAVAMDGLFGGQRVRKQD